jgi:beta-galactosidase
MTKTIPPFLLAVTLIAMASFSTVALGSEPSSREKTSFNAGWRFHPGDPSELKKGELDYAAIKDSLLATGNDFTKTNVVVCPTNNPGADLSFVKPDFDDSSWRKLALPHDWAIEGPFDLKAKGETGKLPYWGQAWYRKQFDLPATDQGKRIFLGIDGAMSYSTVWVNGRFAGGWPYGYSSYQIDITPYLHFGGSNTIAIRLDNPKDSSRWYPGAGIYRNVWLTKTSPLHIAQWGTYITTPEVSPESATIDLKGTIVNQGDKNASASIATEIYELDAKESKGSVPAATLTPSLLEVGAGKSGIFDQRLKLANPKLWDTEHPQRYVAITTVSVDGKPVDRYETPFGIRSFRFDAAEGFFLNGKHVPLNGVCGHHDLGALGAAFNTRAAERQLEILKEMGVNALRTSHNMPAPELLDLCDRMGILVMDESFDCWARGKTPNDYHLFFNDWHERDLRAEYRRDRNHPSVIIWSLGNEIPEQGKAESAPLFAELAQIAHEEDPTRPVTLGGNQVQNYDPAFSRVFDLAGENYDPGMYGGFHRNYASFPNIPLFSSESSSTCSSRGVYFFPPSEGKEDFQVNSYDSFAPGWANLPDDEFAALDRHRYVAGEFVWTGFDYLGEPTPYNADMSNLLNFRNDPAKRAEMEKQLKEFGKIKSPSRSSYFGIVDLCGFKKDRFYLYQARWRPELPMVHILPHWNWPGREGQVTPVYVYTSGDEAELFLNGKSLGKRSTSPGKGPVNLALHGAASASSEEAVKGNLAGNAVNGEPTAMWVASGPDPRQWWQVDLGTVRKIHQLDFSFEKEAANMKYTVLASRDGATWSTLAVSDQARIFGNRVSFTLDASARYLKVEFNTLPRGSWANLSQFAVYDTEKVPSPNPYRLVWDDVVYQPGELKAVAYKDGKKWAEETIKTTGAPAALKLEVDRATISKDGHDLAFVTARVIDEHGMTVPMSRNPITFTLQGPGEIVATDNGDATDLTIFSNPERKAFNGMALAIVRAKSGQSGPMTLTAKSEGLGESKATITSE